MRMVQEVTLEVIYDDRYSEAPSRWVLVAAALPERGSDLADPARLAALDHDDVGLLGRVDQRRPVPSRGPHEESGWDGEAS